LEFRIFYASVVLQSVINEKRLRFYQAPQTLSFVPFARVAGDGADLGESETDGGQDVGQDRVFIEARGQADWVGKFDAADRLA